MAFSANADICGTRERQMSEMGRVLIATIFFCSLKIYLFILCI